LCIFPDLTEIVRRDQDEFQTIDLTNERLERECLAYTTLTFEESKGIWLPLTNAVRSVRSRATFFS